MRQAKNQQRAAQARPEASALQRLHTDVRPAGDGHASNRAGYAGGAGAKAGSRAQTSRTWGPRVNLDFGDDDAPRAIPYARYRRAAVGVLCAALLIGVVVLAYPTLRARWQGGGQASGVLPGVTDTASDGETEPEAPPERETPTASESLPLSVPTDTSPIPTESDPAPDSEPPTVTDGGDGRPGTEPETDGETRPSEPPETMPEGAFPITSLDVSASERGVSYIENTSSASPPDMPAAGSKLWKDAPTVLVVHSHPFEGFGDGREWYDPADGALAQTDSLTAPDGVVALGARLTAVLREAGVTVVHLRVPVAEGASVSATTAATRAAVADYCARMPEIGLVIDLRRSAELTAEGEILRTLGAYAGESCAQVRISVGASRAPASVKRDMAAAMALRSALWAQAPVLSRPVWLKGGAGMAADADATADTGGQVVHLTLEFGAAGNTFAEAERLCTPVGMAVAGLIAERSGN